MRMLLPLILSTLLCSACLGDGGSAPGRLLGMPGPAVVSADDDVAVATDPSGETDGLRLTLSDAEPAAPTPPRAPVETEPLSDAIVQQLLALLPSLPQAPASPGIVLPPTGAPLPPPGRQVTLEFPPRADVEAPDAVPTELQILRITPEGERPLVDHLTLVFSAPMVPLTDLDRVDGYVVPATLTPAAAGRWRWIDPRLLVFEAQGRLPAATRYELSVPAGTTALTGERLPHDVTALFATPAPRVISMTPSGKASTTLQPTLVLRFDQSVDGEALLPFLSLTSERPLIFDRSHALRLASAEERAAALPAEGDAQHTGPASHPWRAVVLVPVEPLPEDSAFHLTMAAGAPSAEGPRTLAQAWIGQFRTRGPLLLVQWEGANLRAGRSPWFRFSNALAPEQDLAALVSTDPPQPELSVSTRGDRLYVSGPFPPGSEVDVIIEPGLTDIHGQQLGERKTVRVVTQSLDPNFSLLGGQVSVLDPFAAPTLAIDSVNVQELTLDLISVQPSDYAAYAFWALSRDAKPDGLKIGTRLTRIQVRPTRRPNEPTRTLVGLAQGFPDDRGHLVAVAFSNEPQHRQVQSAWLQRTDLSLDAASDGAVLQAWVTRLSDGSAVPGAQVSFPSAPGKGSGTDAQGLALLPPLPNADATAEVLVASLAGDSVLLPEGRYAWRWQGQSQWATRPLRDRALFFVFDDRGTYRPGEQAEVQGWLRWRREGDPDDLGQLPTLDGRLSYALSGPRGQTWAEGSLALDAAGGFHLVLDLPVDADPGVARLELDSSALLPSGTGFAEHTHHITVAEFRRPEYEVTVAARESVSLVGSALTLDARAAYYSGAGLADAQVSWNLRAEPGQYSPPGWSGFHFGGRTYGPWERGGSDSGHWTHSAATDAAGNHGLRLDLLAIDPPGPMLLNAEAAVEDVNAQRWAGSLQRLIHPSEAYVGLALDGGFLRAGVPGQLRVIVSDLDGRALDGVEVSLTLTRQVWEHHSEKGWQSVEQPVSQQTLRAGAEPVRASVLAPEGGSHQLHALVRDASGRPNATTLHLWVAGPQTGPPPPQGVTVETLELVPDRQSHAPGQSAEVLVLAPFSSGQGLATLSAGTTLWRQRFTLEGGSHVLTVPITRQHLPEATLRVELVGVTLRTDSQGNPQPDLPPRPAQAAATLSLPVSIDDERLDVTVRPAQVSTTPGSELAISVSVRNSAGEPVPGARVALIVADEAVLALQPWVRPDPLAALLPVRWYDHRQERLRPLVLLGDPGLKLQGRFPVRPAGAQEPDEDVFEETSLDDDFESNLMSLGYVDAGGGGGAGSGFAFAAGAPAMTKAMRGAQGDGGAEAAGPSVSLRTRFDALAAFLPALTTDDGGTVTVTVRLPDSLTRHRITAVAVTDGVRSGSGDASVRVGLPLMVRPSVPRLLNLGDAAELPVVVMNDGDEPARVQLVAVASGLSLDGPVGLAVTVPAHDRVELRLPAQPKSAGEAHLALLVRDSDNPAHADAARISLPVLTPALAEAFAVYGSLSHESARLVVQSPEHALPGFGGLELSFASTALLSLTDAVLALGTYPYGCAEQRASRVLSTLSVAPVLTAFTVPGAPSPEELTAALTEDLSRLTDMQDESGGFSYWHKGQRVDPFLTVHVVHALFVAWQSDQLKDTVALERGMAWLTRLPTHLASTYPPLSERTQATILAYGLWVQHRAGRDVQSAALDLLDRGASHLDGEALAWLLPVLAQNDSARETLRRELFARITETAKGAELATATEADGYVLLHGDRRATSLLLSGLLATDPDHDLVPKLARFLQGHRSAGHWGTTQENVFALLALRAAFAELEAEVPDLSARAWGGERLLADERFVGRSTDQRNLLLPWAPLAELAPDGAPLPVVLEASGPGRLQYRLGLTYALDPEDRSPQSRGFTVSRTYEAMEDATDVRRDADGSWHIRRGARVRVRLQLLNTAERHQVALVDRLPAGLEPVDESLAVTASVPADESENQRPDDSAWFWRCFWWGGPWNDHASLRDAGAEVFATRLSPDLHSYGYPVLASTPGRFVAPPARAEEMYAPETFGHSGADIVIIE